MSKNLHSFLQALTVLPATSTECAALPSWTSTVVSFFSSNSWQGRKYDHAFQKISGFPFKTSTFPSNPMRNGFIFLLLFEPGTVDLGRSYKFQCHQYEEYAWLLFALFKSGLFSGLPCCLAPSLCVLHCETDGEGKNDHQTAGGGEREGKKMTR